MPTNVETRGQDPWQRFLRRFVDAGERAGFTKSFSKGLLAAFLEMVDNAQVHSEAKDTALVGYRYNGGLFEFFVADLGVGVLQSLRTNPEFGSLIDDSEAILRAFNDGVSRFGTGSGRGHGFTTLLRRLAGAGVEMRLRSGDAAVVVAGREPSTADAIPYIRSRATGFFVFVTCRT